MRKFTRNIETDEISFRAFEEEGKRYLSGYASVFNVRSKPIFENNKLFYEIVDPRAFDEVLSNPNLDVIYNVNHNNGSIMGRTKSGTLKLSTDKKGLRFICEVPNTTVGADVYELVSRGDLYECSFAFSVKNSDEVWTKDEDGNNVRTIKKIAKLYDVSTVYSGAYASTDVFAREEDVEEHIEPTPGEDKDEFIAKCIKYVMDAGETDDSKQAYAICMSKWEEKEASDKETKEAEEKEAEEKAQKEFEELYKMKRHIQLLKLKK